MKAALAGVLTGTMVAGALVVASATTAGAQSANSAPGVTANSITVGTISTQTGVLASNFGSLIQGEKAYFDYIDAQGGVNGRKIDYKYQLDDGGNATTFNQLANTLINQDHVFAVTGVGTASFTPNLFVESGIPTYGYNVTNNWAGPKNLFAAGGSVEYAPAGAPSVGFVSRETHSPSIAFVAYGIAASASACQAEAASLQHSGYNISYTDYKVNYPGTTVATDVQRMKQAGSNMVVSCMDVQGNINMARAVKQYGLHITQLWFNGNDQPTLNANQSLMQGIYFNIAHVPFTASQSDYPGLKLYLTEMKKYEPAYAQDEVAIQGLGIGSALRPGREDGRQQPHVGERHQRGQLPDGLHGERAAVAHELEGRRPQRPCAALLQRRHQGLGEQIRGHIEHGEERVQLLRLSQPEEESGVPAAARHACSRLIGAGG